MAEAKFQKNDLSELTKKLLIQFLSSKGSVLHLKDFGKDSLTETQNNLKVIFVMKAVGFVCFLTDHEFVFVGTIKTVLKYVKFAQEKASKYEAENVNNDKNSITSGEVIQNYLFRPPKDFGPLSKQHIQVGVFELPALELHMLCDFIEQVAMEMLFDPSEINRQVNQQKLHCGADERVLHSNE